MNIAKPKKSKLMLIIIATLLVVATLAVYIFWFKGSFFGWSPINKSATTSIDYNQPTHDQISGGDAIKDQTSTSSNTGSDPNNVGSDRPVAPITKPGDTKGTVTVTISAANQNDGVLQVRTLISAIASSGNCTLSLTKDGMTISRTSEIQSLPSSSTCKGFDIPEAELTKGTWTAKLIFENETIKGETTRNITVL
jgi:hypothetical protein